MSSIQRISRIPFHPILFGLYPVLKFLDHNVKEVELIVSVRMLIGVLLGVSVLFLFFRVLLRDWERSAVMVSIMTLLFFSYGHVYSALKHVNVLGEIVGRHRYLIIVYLILLAVGWLWAIRKGRKTDITVGMNVIGFALLIVPMFHVVSYELIFRRVPSSVAPPVLEQPQKDPSFYPDVYYIIPDAYTRQDTLLEFYEYDNTPFLEALEDRGFYVARCSQSNYAWTQLSLGSSLNMNYIQEIYHRQDRNGLTSVVRNSLVRQILESIGYKFVAFDTAYTGTQWHDAAYYYSVEEKSLLASVFPNGLREYEALFFRTTMGLIFLDVDTIFQMRLHEAITESPKRDRYERTKYILDMMDSVITLPSPKFVFVHILSTHYPYVFGKDGEYQPDQKDPISGYRDVVEYTNSRILDFVDAILARSSIPPIILIQGDHGTEETQRDFRRMNILNAYYLPDGGSDDLYATITPVNTFRIIMDTYFSQDYGLLPDVSYLSLWPNLLKFEEVPDNWSGCTP